MSLKLTPLSLAALLITQTWSATVSAQSDRQKCDGRAMSKLIQSGKAEALEHFSAACGIDAADARGFSLYDRARLAGSREVTEAIRAQGQYSEGSYSPAMGKLIQTGLRFLNFDAGIIDGRLGDRSLAAIRRYQKKNGFAEDGLLHDDWLADFYRRLIKKTQQELTDLGFDAGGADGVIGPKTMTAMQAFRQERQIPAADYRAIDDQLLYQLMMLSHEKNKKELAKRDAERAARRAAQEAARRKEIARAREEAQRRAEAKRQAAEAAAIAARQQREAEERRVKLLDMAAEKNQAEAQQREAQIARQQTQAEQQRIADAAENAAEQARVQAQRSQQSTEEQRARGQAGQARAAQQRAAAEAQAKAQAERARMEAEQARIAGQKAIAERAAAQQRAREEQARQAALAAKAAEERAAREAAASAQAADQARQEAQQALRAAKNNQPIVLSQDMVRATAVQGAVPVSKGFNELKGILHFTGPTSCTVAGQPIESGWCESYHPGGKGKQCTVVMSKSGIVVSFLCD